MFRNIAMGVGGREKIFRIKMIKISKMGCMGGRINLIEHLIAFRLTSKIKSVRVYPQNIFRFFLSGFRMNLFIFRSFQKFSNEPPLVQQ